MSAPPGPRDIPRSRGCRVNDALRARREAHAAGLQYITDAELPAQLTAAKASPEQAWLGGVCSVVLQQSLADLNTAYRPFGLGRSLGWAMTPIGQGR